LTSFENNRVEQIGASEPIWRDACGDERANLLFYRYAAHHPVDNRWYRPRFERYGRIYREGSTQVSGFRKTIVGIPLGHYYCVQIGGVFMEKIFGDAISYVSS